MRQKALSNSRLDYPTSTFHLPTPRFWAGLEANLCWVPFSCRENRFCDLCNFGFLPFGVYPAERRESTTRSLLTHLQFASLKVMLPHAACMPFLQVHALSIFGHLNFISFKNLWNVFRLPSMNQTLWSSEIERYGKAKTTNPMKLACGVWRQLWWR